MQQGNTTVARLVKGNFLSRANPVIAKNGLPIGLEAIGQAN